MKNELCIVKIEVTLHKFAPPEPPKLESAHLFSNYPSTRKNDWPATQPLIKCSLKTAG